MKSITIHNIDENTTALIEQKSREWKLSLNKTIQRLLRQSLGISSESQSKEDEFREFFGVWDDDDYQEFERNTADLRKIDPEDWK